MEVGLTHWIALSGIVFSLGLYGAATRKNPIMVLMSLELVLNASAINFIAFNYYLASEAIHGQVFAVFIIAVAAAETALALAIVIRLFRHYGTIDLGDATQMSH